MTSKFSYIDNKGQNIIILYHPDSMSITYYEKRPNGDTYQNKIQAGDGRQTQDALYDLGNSEMGRYMIVISEQCDELQYPEGGKIIEATDGEGRKHTVIRTDLIPSEPLEPVEFTTEELLNDMKVA